MKRNIERLIPNAEDRMANRRAAMHVGVCIENLYEPKPGMLVASPR
jgi:hypothetical protein